MEITLTLSGNEKMKLIDQIKNVVENHQNVTEVDVAKGKASWAGSDFIYIHLDRENYDGSDVWNLILSVDGDSVNAIAWDNIDGASEVSVMNEDVIEWVTSRIN